MIRKVFTTKPALNSCYPHANRPAERLWDSVSSFPFRKLTRMYRDNKRCLKWFELWNTTNLLNFCHLWLRKLREIGSKEKNKEHIGWGHGKNPQTHAFSCGHTMSVGSIPSEPGLFEMQCGTQLPVAPPSLTGPHATLLNRREQTKVVATTSQIHRTAKAEYSPAE